MKGRKNAGVSVGDVPSARKRPWGTLALALICAVTFGWTWGNSSFVLVENWGRLDPGVLRAHGALDWLSLRESGQWWRLFTAAGLHGAWWHLLLNLWALFVLGSMVERRLGPGVWFASVSVSVLSSGLAAMAWGGANVVVGISGVVFGLGGTWLGARMGAGNAHIQSSREPFGEDARDALGESSTSAEGPTELSSKELTFWLGVTLGAGVVWPELSQAGHVGGLVGGALVGAAVRWPRSSLIWFPLAVVSGWVAHARIVSDPQDAEDWARLGYTYMDVERYPEGWAAFDSALASGPSESRPEWLNAGAYARALGSSDPEVLRHSVGMVEEALADEPENPDRLDTLGWLLCIQGQTVEGSSQLNAALEFAGDAPSEELLKHIEECDQQPLRESSLGWSNVPRGTP